MLPTFWRYSCLLSALILFQGHVSAVVLDWDNVPWTEGSLNNSYQADPAAPESFLTIDVSSNNGANLVPYAAAPNPMTPVVNQVFQGGLPSVESTLTLAVNLSDPSQSITLKVSFAASGGASNVSFKLFDIDAGGGSQDQLSSIYAVSIDGITLIAPTITTSADNTLIGTGVNQSVVGTANTASLGATSGRGNVTIDFGTNLIQSFTFSYGSTAAFADPNYQHFGLHDINFTPVPEMNPSLLSAFSCALAAGFVFRHRGRARPKFDT